MPADALGRVRVPHSEGSITPLRDGVVGVVHILTGGHVPAILILGADLRRTNHSGLIMASEREVSVVRDQYSEVSTQRSVFRDQYSEVSIQRSVFRGQYSGADLRRAYHF